jgi:O-antigen/teichoic acid export membrane protein
MNVRPDQVPFSQGGAGRASGVSPIGPGGSLEGEIFAAQPPAQMKKANFNWPWKPKRSGAAIKRPRQLAASSIGALSVYAAGAALSYLSQLWVARTIGAESFGIYSYVFAWVTMLGYLSTLGFHVSLLRFLPAYRAKERWPLARGVIRFSQTSAFCAGIAVVLIGAGVIFVLQKSIRPELAMTFVIGILTVPLIAQHQISAAQVRAFGGIVKSMAPERVVRDGVLLTIVAIASWSGLVPADAKMAMGAALIGALATLGLLRYFLRRLRPAELARDKPEYAKTDWLQPAVPVMFIVVADSLMSRSGVIVLGLTGNLVEAGVFAVALSMSLLTALPRMAVAAAFAPTVSDLYARDDHAGLEALSGKASVLSLLGTLGIAVPLLALNTPLLALFGQTFVAGAPIVVVLVLAQVFAAACGPQQHLITMTGNERSGAAIMFVCAIANLAVCLLAIKPFGTMGVALGMAATLVVWNVAMGIYIRRRLRMAPGLILALKSLRNKG